MSRNAYAPLTMDTTPAAGRPSSSKQPFIRILNAITTSAALSQRQAPVTALSTTGMLYTKDYRAAKFLFTGTQGITGGVSAKFQVHLYHPIGTNAAGDASGNLMYIPQLAAKGYLQLGTARVGASAAAYALLTSATCRVVDVIKDTADYAGTWVLNSTNGVNAFMEIPLQGAVAARVEVKGFKVTSGGQMAQVACFAKLQDDSYRPYA